MKNLVKVVDYRITLPLEDDEHTTPTEMTLNLEIYPKAISSLNINNEDIIWKRVGEALTKALGLRIPEKKEKKEKKETRAWLIEDNTNNPKPPVITTNPKIAKNLKKVDHWYTVTEIKII